MESKTWWEVYAFIFFSQHWNFFHGCTLDTQISTQIEDTKKTQFLQSQQDKTQKLKQQKKKNYLEQVL